MHGYVDGVLHCTKTTLSKPVHTLDCYQAYLASLQTLSNRHLLIYMLGNERKMAQLRAAFRCLNTEDVNASDESGTDSDIDIDSDTDEEHVVDLFKDIKYVCCCLCFFFGFVR
jgi:hypothetical protein